MLNVNNVLCRPCGPQLYLLTGQSSTGVRFCSEINRHSVPELTTTPSGASKMSILAQRSHNDIYNDLKAPLP